MASGKIIGSVSGTSASKYNFWVEWNSKAYTVGNYSLVSATAYLQRNDGYANSAYNLNVSAKNKSITVDGNKTTSTEKGIDTRNSSKVIIASSKNIKVEHETNGEKTITISAMFPYVVSNLSGGTLSQKVTLDKIDVSKLELIAEIKTVSQNFIEAVLTTNEAADEWYYSLDNGKQWIILSNELSKKITCRIENLKDNTQYSMWFKARKHSNQTESIFKKNIKTLPIFVTEILSQDEIVIGVGETKNILYQILPENASIKTLDISSGNNSIVKVEQNKIIGKEKGIAKIYLLTQDGSEILKNINVAVTQKVTGIYSSAKHISIPKNESVKLQYTILPENADNKNVTYISSDRSIVDIVEDNIFGVENGNAEIKIITEDGGFETSISISVSGEYVWHDYSEAIDVLNSQDIDNIKSNMDTIRSMLLLNGDSVASLNALNNSVDIQYEDMFDLLSNIEYNLDILNGSNEISQARSIYYIEPKVITNVASNKEDIWRWIQILNDMYNILNGTFPKWQRLVLISEDEDLFLAPTINDKYIILRGDFVGSI